MLPWIAAVGILGWLILRVSPDQLGGALARGPHLPFFFYTLLANAAFVVADGWSTQRMLGMAGCHRPLRELILVRGALNLVGLLHVVAVQAVLVLYLHRTGESRGRAALLVAAIIVTQVVGLVILGAPGIWLSELPTALRVGYPLGLVGVTVGVVALPWIGRTVGERVPRLAILGRLDRRLLVGATVVRLPHLVVLALGPLGALWIWDIAVPWVEGLILMPTALLVSALPLTPAGFGTTQAAMVWLFSPWAPGIEGAAREAAVFGASLTWTSYGWLGQLAIGVLCFLALPTRLRALTSSAAADATAETAEPDVK